MYICINCQLYILYIVNNRLKLSVLFQTFVDISSAVWNVDHNQRYATTSRHIVEGGHLQDRCWIPG